MGNVRVERSASRITQVQPKRAKGMAPPAQDVANSPLEAPQMPSYTPLAADWAASNNLMRSLAPEEDLEQEMAPVQAKLTIGQPGDKYEQEADRMAAQVVQQIHAPAPSSTAGSGSVQRMGVEDEEELQLKPINGSIQRMGLEEEEELQMKPDSVLQRQEGVEEEEEELQMKPDSILQRQEGVEEEEEELQMKPMVQLKAMGGAAASEDMESSIQQARGGGQALSDDIRGSMEGAFNADFSGVKVHTDSQSDQLNRSIQAKAFTTGQDIFFRGGAYDPGSKGGQELLAHELTHVVQQSGGAVQRKNKG